MTVLNTQALRWLAPSDAITKRRSVSLANRCAKVERSFLRDDAGSSK